MNTEEFIAKARLVHGDRYDYSKTVYHYRNLVTITCKIHGDFQIRYDHHIGKKRGGCRQCFFDSVRGTKEGFIAKARLVHGDRYDYSKFEYVNAQTKSIIICPKHGEFTHTPASHLDKCGCPTCRRIRQRIPLSQFVEKAKSIHNNKYDYSKAVYSGSNEYLKIICPEHGVFEKTPDNHCHKTRPQGCPKCVEYFGYRDILPGYLYLFLSDDSKFIKIGISNNPKKRIKKLKKSTPFDFNVLEIVKFNDGSEARKWERMFHKMYQSAELSGFDGCTEWFKYDKAVADWYRWLKGAK